MERMLALCAKCGEGYDMDAEPAVECGHDDALDWRIYTGDPVDLLRFAQNVLQLDPAEHATGSRDFGRGFAHAMSLIRFEAHQHGLGV